MKPILLVIVALVCWVQSIESFNIEYVVYNHSAIVTENSTLQYRIFMDSRMTQVWEFFGIFEFNDSCCPLQVGFNTRFVDAGNSTISQTQVVLPLNRVAYQTWDICSPQSSAQYVELTVTQTENPSKMAFQRLAATIVANPEIPVNTEIYDNVPTCEVSRHFYAVIPENPDPTLPRTIEFVTTMDFQTIRSVFNSIYLRMDSCPFISNGSYDAGGIITAAPHGTLVSFSTLKSGNLYITLDCNGGVPLNWDWSFQVTVNQYPPRPPPPKNILKILVMVFGAVIATALFIVFIYFVSQRMGRQRRHRLL